MRRQLEHESIGLLYLGCLLLVSIFSMSIETISERLFKQHCTDRGVPCVRIEETTYRVPDYELMIGSSTVFAEVKQLDPNERDRAREAVPAGQLVGSAISPYKRVRNLLGEAYAQLRPYARKGHPTIVVCYNNAGILNFIDNFTITRAMFGGMAVRISLEPDGVIRPTGQGFTGGRKVTRNSCRGLSAICVLTALPRNETKLIAYHNPYATNAISPDSMRRLADSQFGYADPHSGWNVDLFPFEIQP